jgi:hypothetical protein
MKKGSTVQDIMVGTISHLFLVLCWLPFSCLCQAKFDPQQLLDSRKNGGSISQLLQTKEIPSYPENQTNCVYLKNGLRSFKFTNENEWQQLRDTVEPYKIDIVYSRYPLKNGKYTEVYPLLVNRLKALFALDPSLNDQNMDWNKILQTNCKNEEQVRTLFHGVVIWYHSLSNELPEDEILQENERLLAQELLRKKSIPNSVETIKIKKVYSEPALKNTADQNSLEEIQESVRKIKSFSFIPDSLIRILSSQSLDDQINSIKSFLEKDIDDDLDITLKDASKEELLMYKKETELFLDKFPATDSVVFKVLNRHPEWKNMLVVNDWTGSMYGYGAQVLLWHLQNFEKSGIKSLTLFNDGDSKPNYQKKIGETGGIYVENPDNILTIQKKFNFIMLQGMGGDPEENVIEALMTAIQETPFFKEIVLIADNNACIRDIQLIPFIDRPVKVILCGYEPSKGINPDLVYLAKKTQGGIYTLTEDIEHITLEYDSLGKQNSILDHRFRISELNCPENRMGVFDTNTSYSIQNHYDLRLYFEENTNLNFARHHKRRTDKFICKNDELTDIPKSLFAMKKLTYINFTNNNLEKIDSKIGNLRYLKEVNLSFNKIRNLPPEFKDLVYIENLNLSFNRLGHIPGYLLKMNFLINLDLSHNQLTRFENNIRLHSIQKINISHNKLTELSKEIGSMRKLQILDASNNLLLTVPKGLTNLTNLEELNLKNNQLTELPLLLFKLKKLKVLNLQNNKFSEEEKHRIQSILIDTKIFF